MITRQWRVYGDVFVLFSRENKVALTATIAERQDMWEFVQALSDMQQVLRDCPKSTPDNWDASPIIYEG